MHTSKISSPTALSAKLLSLAVLQVQSLVTVWWHQFILLPSSYLLKALYTEQITFFFIWRVHGIATNDGWQLLHILERTAIKSEGTQWLLSKLLSNNWHADIYTETLSLSLAEHQQTMSETPQLILVKQQSWVGVLSCLSLWYLHRQPGAAVHCHILQWGS